jgi:rubrerythrin
MKSVEEFLAHTIQLESESALRFGQLADAMTTAGNREVGRLFRRLADYSLLHLGDARERSGFRTLPVMTASDYCWPDIESPEAAAIWAADPFIGREQALQVALDAEQAGLDFYTDILQTTTDPEIRVLAKEFVEEESQHVAELKRWMQLHLSGAKLPTDN